MKKIVLFMLMLTMVFSVAHPVGYAAGGNAEDLYADGMKYYDAAEYEHAFSYFLISGDRKGYAPAQNMLGVCYRDGLGTEQDIEEAERYFSLSAEQGYESAQENLAALAEARDTESNEKQQAYQTAMNLYFAGEYEAAKAAFEALGDYEHSADFLALCDNALQEASAGAQMEQIEAGDAVVFSPYEQDNSGMNTTVHSAGIVKEENIAQSSPRVYGEISIERVEASSELVEDGFTYQGNRIADGNKATCWAEGGAGYGIGETITLYLNGVYDVSKISITGGWAISRELFDHNAKPKTMNVYFSSSPDEHYVLNLDETMSTQNFQLDEKGVKWIRFEIVDIYPGDKGVYDTCISEITIY